MVGATGRQVAKHEQGDRWIYEYDAPNYKDWVATGGTGLTEYVRVVDGINVRLIEKDEQWLKTTANEVERALRFFNRKFGQYPYPDLVVSCCVGMEWPGLMFTVPLPGKDPRQEERYLYVTHHELAHQWFYGIVGNDQYSVPWMDEGFTTYADRSFWRTLGRTPYGGDLTNRVFTGPKVSSSQNKWAVAGGSWASPRWTG